MLGVCLSPFSALSIEPLNGTLSSVGAENGKNSFSALSIEPLNGTKVRPQAPDNHKPTFSALSIEPLNGTR